MTETILVPDLGDDVKEGTVVNIAVAVGEMVSEGQTLLEVETDKVVLEIPATKAGCVTELYLVVDNKVSQGDKIISLALGSLEADSPSEPNKAVTKQAPSESVTADPITQTKLPPEVAIAPTHEQQIVIGAIFPAGPGTRRLAREIGVAISDVTGSGPRGRISIADVKAYAKQRAKGQQVVTAHANTAQKSLPDLSAYGNVHRQAMTGIERITSENMSHAWTQIPHAWLQEKIDITELEAARQRHKGTVKAQTGGSLTITAIIVKALSQTLRQFPRFNAAFDAHSNEVVYLDYCHIGVAVDTPAGLVVPKVENADQKGLMAISSDLVELADKARKRKLTAKDLSGAGITVSNLGGLGLSGIFPIVNWPQVAILGIAASQIEACFINGEFKPRLMMPVTLAFDHRMINGADGARFIAYLKQLLEDSFALLL